MARSTVKVKTHSPQIAAMLKSEPIANEVHRRSEPVLDQQIATCPELSGALKASLRIWDDVTDRAVSRVGSDLLYAMVVESRTGFMSRSVDAAGGS